MNARLNESSLDAHAWLNDKLGRKDDADYLTAYLTGKYAASKEMAAYQSFVLNVNAEWGFGKTFLLTNWRIDLQRGGHPTVYFNAWETDYSEDPLIAFIAELESQLQPFLSKKAKASFRRAIKKGKQLLKPSVPLLLEILTKKTTGYAYEELQAAIRNHEPESANVSESPKADEEDVGKPISTLVSKAAEEALKEHKTRRKSISEFKNALAELCNQIAREEGKNRLPIFVLVDELDRCRPPYALALLEVIKHIFGVQGVYFVVATDSGQLSHAVQAVYGAAFDARRYLMRFFDQEYSLPNPDIEKYASYLLERLGITNANNLFHGLRAELYPGKSPIAVMFSAYAKYFGLGLRDLEQCTAALDAIRLTAGPHEKIHLGITSFLIMSRHMWRMAFDRFVKTGSTEVFRDDIRTKSNQSTEFKTLARLDGGHYGQSAPSSISVQELSYFYIDLLKKTPNDVRLATYNNQLQEEISYEMMEPHRLSLDTYIHRVARAGDMRAPIR